MRAIAKRTEPQSLTHHRCNTHANYNNYPDKDELRASLVAEQGYICCYCMGRIYPTLHEMKIEHWHSQDKYPAEQLDYGNLLGACLGNKDKPGEPKHCDTFKGDNDLSRNPATPAHQVENYVHYLGDGRVNSPDPQFNIELEKVLNLNYTRLVSNRKAVIDGLRKGLPDGPLSRSELQRRIDQWSTPGSDGYYRPYCGVVIYWLKKRLTRI